MNNWLKIAYLAAIFLVVFGAKLWLVDRSGSDVPAWDQWDGIGGNIFLPYAGHTLTAADFLKPHNEHRILFTRLLSLGLMRVNQQWDNRVETVADALLHALTAVLLFGMILQWGPRQISVPLGFPVVALAFALPFSWENALFGFQSQFYFQIFFSIAAMVLLALNPPWSRSWLAGWGLGLLCIFTTASGLLAAAAVLIFMVFEGVRTPRRWKAACLTVIAVALIIFVGWILNVNLDRHQALRAHSISQWIAAFGLNLSWPNLAWPSLNSACLAALAGAGQACHGWLALINWLPFGLLAWVVLRTEGLYPKLEKVILVLGIWVLLQSAAMAYARGGPSWRYMDLMSLGMVVNVISIGLLMVRHPFPRARGVMALACAAWMMICGAGLLALTWRAVQVEIPGKTHLADVQRSNLREFMATGDSRCLAGKPAEEISFPATDTWVLICLLRDPFIRSILPAGLRQPLRVEQDRSYGHAFVTNGVDPAAPVSSHEIAWGSYSDRGPAAEGAFVSQPLFSRFPFLRFDLAGFLGDAYLAMTLREQGSSRLETEVQPDRPAGLGWNPCLVRTPKGSFSIEAIDDHARSWFAFKEPVELGWLSWGAIQLARGGMVMLAAGILLFGLIEVWRYFNNLHRVF